MSKQKMQSLVLGVLVLAVVGVGAFQFLGPKPKAVVTVKKDGPKTDDPTLVAANTADPMKVYVQSLIEGGGSPRDPFVPQAVVLEEDPHPQGTQTQVPGPNMGNGHPFNGFDPNGVRPVEINTTGLGTGADITHGTALRNPNDLPYLLRGVMIGKQNMAVFEGDGGTQFLVLEGQKFGDTTVVSIDETGVVVNYRGKVKTLPLLGGN